MKQFKGGREEGRREENWGAVRENPQYGLFETLWNYLAAIFVKTFVDLHNNPMQFFPIKKNIPKNKSSFWILITLSFVMVIIVISLKIYINS